MNDFSRSEFEESVAQESVVSSDGSTPEMIKPKKYLCFSDAHRFAKTLNFKTRKEWRMYVKGSMGEKPVKPDNVPAHPDGIYRLKGWQGWKYWLGTANQGISK